MDLVSASVEKLEPLPPSTQLEGGGGGGGREEDAGWVEEMEEKVQRGECVVETGMDVSFMQVYWMIAHPSWFTQRHVQYC